MNKVGIIGLEKLEQVLANIYLAIRTKQLYVVIIARVCLVQLLPQTSLDQHSLKI